MPVSPLDSSAATRSALFTVGADPGCQIAQKKHANGLKKQALTTYYAHTHLVMQNTFMHQWGWNSTWNPKKCGCTLEISPDGTLEYQQLKSYSP